MHIKSVVAFAALSLVGTGFAAPINEENRVSPECVYPLNGQPYTRPERCERLSANHGPNKPGADIVRRQVSDQPTYPNPPPSHVKARRDQPPPRPTDATSQAGTDTRAMKSPFVVVEDKRGGVEEGDTRGDKLGRFGLKWPWEKE